MVGCWLISSRWFSNAHVGCVLRRRRSGGPWPRRFFMRLEAFITESSQPEQLNSPSMASASMLATRAPCVAISAITCALCILQAVNRHVLNSNGQAAGMYIAHAMFKF